MRAPEKPDTKLFWSMIVLGLPCLGFGMALAWLAYASAREARERSLWVNGSASLIEVGIRYLPVRRGSNYYVTARYLLQVNGRTYEGSEIAGGSSPSGVDVRTLIVPYAPEAATFKFEELGYLTPQHTWIVVGQSAPARYDPNDPARSQIVLRNPIGTKTGSSCGLIGMTVVLLLTGSALLVFAWPAGRGRAWGKSEVKPPAGPELKEYPEAERKRLLQCIEILQDHIKRQSGSGATPEMSSYAEQIEEMAAEAREGKLVPVQHANSGLGRGASEIFNVGHLVSAAQNLQACLDELAKQKGPRKG